MKVGIVALVLGYVLGFVAGQVFDARTAPVVDLDLGCAEARAEVETWSRAVLANVDALRFEVDDARQARETAWEDCVVPGAWLQAGVVPVPDVLR